MTTLSFTNECDNMVRNVYYASVHFISKDDYEDMIRNFYGSFPVTPVLKTKDDIGYDADGVSCDTHYIQFECDDAVQNHYDVELSPQDLPGAGEQLTNPVAGEYSVQFFRGLEYLFPDGAFYFSKARTPKGEFTLVILVKVNNKPIYYGDLTNMFP
jgi:hypothetical protein